MCRRSRLLAEAQLVMLHQAFCAPVALGGGATFRAIAAVRDRELPRTQFRRDVLAVAKKAALPLARELGLRTRGARLGEALGSGVRAILDIEEAQRPRCRKADAEGLRREVQPEEPAPVKKAAKKAAASRKAEPAASVDVLEPEAPPTAAVTEPATAPPVEPAAPEIAPAPVAPAVRDPRLITSRPASEQPEVHLEPHRESRDQREHREQREQREARPRPAAAAAGPSPSAPPAKPEEQRPPLSQTGKPIPPPPSAPPRSASGKPIPPPPGMGGLLRRCGVPRLRRRAPPGGRPPGWRGGGPSAPAVRRASLPAAARRLPTSLLAQVARPSAATAPAASRWRRSGVRFGRGGGPGGNRPPRPSQASPSSPD